jgi:hypothetical protein
MSTPPKNREEAKNKAIKEAEIEGARIYNEGFTNITSSMNKQFTKGLEYDGDVSEALDTGYNRAKAKDKVKKASGGAVKGYAPGGAIKKVKPLTSEILSATDKRRRKLFLSKSAVPKRRPGKKTKYVKAASGGLLKAAPNKGLTKLPQGVRNNMGFMKKGGAVKKMKKCRMDGIALRGKTRAKQRSK